jgi:hypothetical protein
MVCNREGSLCYMLFFEYSISMLSALVRESRCRPQTIAAYPSRHTTSGEHPPDFLNSNTLARKSGAVHGVRHGLEEPSSDYCPRGVGLALS